MNEVKHDFTPKWNWPELMPPILADRKAGLSLTQLSAKHGPPAPSISTHLTAYYKKNPAEKIGIEQAKEGTEAPVFPPPTASLEASRIAARQLLHDAIVGSVDPTAQRIAAARLLLKDELDPADEDRNPYAGTSEDELAERILTLAASILGVERCAQMLKALAQDGMADVVRYDGPDMTSQHVVTTTTDDKATNVVESVLSP